MNKDQHKRQPHKLEFKNGESKKYYKITFLRLKREALIRHIKYKLHYISNNIRGKFGLHTLKNSKKILQNQLLPTLIRGSWGDFDE
jgi:hypothetical protein